MLGVDFSADGKIAEVSMALRRYFAEKKSLPVVVIRVFLVLLLAFAISFFLWSVMKYNEIMEEKQEKEEQVAVLNERIDQLQYLVEAPLDDSFKIRIAREKLGMCFPDEIIFHTGLD